MFTHPNYNLPVYEGALGEAPKQGNFYKPKSGDTLSSIVSKAYGSTVRPMVAVGILNKSQYNKESMVYRADSAKCNSARTAAGVGYISLCQADYPNRSINPIWVPASDVQAEPTVPTAPPQPENPNTPPTNQIKTFQLNLPKESAAGIKYVNVLTANPPAQLNQYQVVSGSIKPINQGLAMGNSIKYIAIGGLAILIGEFIWKKRKK